MAQRTLRRRTRPTGTPLCGCSSAGRAPGSQPGRRRFESGYPLLAAPGGLTPLNVVRARVPRGSRARGRVAEWQTRTVQARVSRKDVRVQLPPRPPQGARAAAPWRPRSRSRTMPGRYHPKPGPGGAAHLEGSPSLAYGAALLMPLGPPSRVRISLPPLGSRQAPTLGTPEAGTGTWRGRLVAYGAVLERQLA